MQKTKISYPVMIAILLLMFVVLLKTAWISDDAAITLRSVLNFLNGYGPNFNIDERVQAFTHPLWFLLLSLFSALSGNIFITTFALPIVISLLVIWLLLTRIALNLWIGLFAAAVLLLSKAYIDFSTSGLENPLSHLILLIIVIFGLKSIEAPNKQNLLLCLLASAFLYLSRPDLILLVAPFCLLVIYKNYQSPKQLFKVILIASIPAVIWTLFSLIYYGFPFPNTAYAKLGSGIPRAELAIQGGIYLLDSMSRDPITLATIFLGLFVGLRSGKTNAMLALGGVLYLVYIVNVGGDFMSGRFLTTPLLIAIILLSRIEFPVAAFGIIAISLMLLGIIKSGNTLFGDLSFDEVGIPESGITDERGFYFQMTGLFTANESLFENPEFKKNQRVVIIHGVIGFNGIFRGSSTHIIDIFGLSDPLLARLPAKYNKNWRIGHFRRQFPTGYLESVKQERNLLTDPVTKDFYEAIRIVTQAPLFSVERLNNIVRLNLGLVPQPDSDYYKYQLIPY